MYKNKIFGGTYYGEPIRNDISDGDGLYFPVGSSEFYDTQNIKYTVTELSNMYNNIKNIILKNKNNALENKLNNIKRKYIDNKEKQPIKSKQKDFDPSYYMVTTQNDQKSDNKEISKPNDFDSSHYIVTTPYNPKPANKEILKPNPQKQPMDFDLSQYMVSDPYKLKYDKDIQYIDLKYLINNYNIFMNTVVEVYNRIAEIYNSGLKWTLPIHNYNELTLDETYIPYYPFVNDFHQQLIKNADEIYKKIILILEVPKFENKPCK
jgi:hypothetical protein